MSWVEKLSRTYELAEPCHKGIRGERGELLWPLFHCEFNAHVEVVLSHDGDFLGAQVNTGDLPTLIPCTLKSEARTSGPVSHPLIDKLQYCAPDYSQFIDGKDSRFSLYDEQLNLWSCSNSSHWKVRAVQTYLRKGKLIQDLVRLKVFYVDKDEKLSRKWQGTDSEKPGIFDVLKGVTWQGDAVVRWKVRSPGEMNDTTWTDPTLWESWITYYRAYLESECQRHKQKTWKVSDKDAPIVRKGLCYVTHNPAAILSELHASSVRSSADSAKLISSNDSSGFTFRGRFDLSSEVCGIDLSVSQKAHSALRWLFARQGDWKTGLVTWVLSDQGVDIVDPTAGTIEAGDNDITLPDDYDAGQGVALRFRTKLNGYRKSLGNSDDVILIGLDAATPGRLAITTYRELKASEYLDRLEAWHGEKESEGVVGCVWWQDFGYDKARNQWKRFWGAPSPKDIAEACYGTRLDETLRRNTVERLLPCILDGVSIPTDLMLTAFHRAANRVGLDVWEWRKVLGIACALYRKHSFDHEKRRYSMSLELDRKSRDYLYGRLLAVADKVERMALTSTEKGRETTAARYMQRFADHPVETWKSIELAIVPYKMRLGAKAKAYFALFDEIGDLFVTADFLNPRALTGEFLLGYHCQSFWFSKYRSEKGQWVERESIQDDDNEEKSED
jgi:CRISPR-associated protein Csd1